MWSEIPHEAAHQKLLVNGEAATPELPAAAARIKAVSLLRMASLVGPDVWPRETSIIWHSQVYFCTYAVSRLCACVPLHNNMHNSDHVHTSCSSSRIVHCLLLLAYLIMRDKDTYM